MQEYQDQRFILHVSDFHLTEKESDLQLAKNALNALTLEIESQRINIDYLLHTGDIIDSTDIYQKTAETIQVSSEYMKSNIFDVESFKKKASEQEKCEFDHMMIKIMHKRFDKAIEVFRTFIADLNVSLGRVVICSGNHDVPRFVSMNSENVCCDKDDKGNWNYCDNNGVLLSDSEDPFEVFLNTLGVANRNTSSYYQGEKNNPIKCLRIDNLNFIILNTNWNNPADQKHGYYCVRCDSLDNLDENLFEFDDSLVCPPNIIIAHKPIYEICEKARLSYQRYIKTNFMSKLQKYIGNNGIYFCGDKHTRSIVGSFIHDIPHYIGGEPLKLEKLPLDVEYNLVELDNNQVGIGRKVHLRYTESNKWICDIRPQDNVISKLYNLCKPYVFENTFDIVRNGNSFNSWENVCQEIYNWKNSNVNKIYNILIIIFRSICKYREQGINTVNLENKNIFGLVEKRIHDFDKTQKNILNIRGEHGSGKSVFLSALYVYLLYRFSVGSFNMIPAYFSLDCKKVTEELKDDGAYCRAATKVFKEFVEQVQAIAKKEKFSVCYIIDGLDEQDCWSYRTEDSVGRWILDILSKYNNASYIMSFSQQKLPCFKNTMPERTYNDKSDILYFNPIDIQEKDSTDTRFVSFVKNFCKLENLYIRSKFNGKNRTKVLCLSEHNLNNVYATIRSFRRLTINPDFIYHNYDYISNHSNKSLTNKQKDIDVTISYQYFIDRQYELCLSKLGYGFIRYAPAMAYLFTFKGYTYERFKRIDSESKLEQHLAEEIRNNREKIYNAFVFIKKNKDIRTYLIAIHYNREIRFYTENPGVAISENSILNEFIDRDISIMIRKLWTDSNKFVIACKQLFNRDDLPICLFSIIFYCLAHIDLYEPIKEELYNQLKEHPQIIKIIKGGQENDWTFDNSANYLDKIKKFYELSLMHTLTVYQAMDTNASLQVINTYCKNIAFREFNRQYQMLYYGDTTLHGEDKRRSLSLGQDIISKGFDFHNTFNHLIVKVNSDSHYPLYLFDLFTIADLVYSRLCKDTIDNDYSETPDNLSFFFHPKYCVQSKKVLFQAKKAIDTYLDFNCIENDFCLFLKEVIQTILKGINKE